jgi:hypothetical protein
MEKMQFLDPALSLVAAPVLSGKAAMPRIVMP